MTLVAMAMTVKSLATSSCHNIYVGLDGADLIPCQDLIMTGHVFQIMSAKK